MKNKCFSLEGYLYIDDFPYFIEQVKKSLTESDNIIDYKYEVFNKSRKHLFLITTVSKKNKKSNYRFCMVLFDNNTYEYQYNGEFNKLDDIIDTYSSVSK
jgi:hypothetical protein